LSDKQARQTFKGQQTMNDETEAKIRRRAKEMSEGESDPTAEQNWLKAEHEVTEEGENAAISRWAAPVSGTYVENSNEAARDAEKVRETNVAERKSEAEHQEQPVTSA
jgi:hypothetical protein